jgi:hypothetical protein
MLTTLSKKYVSPFPLFCRMINCCLCLLLGLSYPFRCGLDIAEAEPNHLCWAQFPLSNFTTMLFHYDGVVDQWHDLPWSNQSIHIVGLHQTKWYMCSCPDSSCIETPVCITHTSLFIGGCLLSSLSFGNASGGLQSGLCTQTFLHNTITSSFGMKTWESRIFTLTSETTTLL